MMHVAKPESNPIIMTTSNVHLYVISQQKNITTSAVPKQQPSAISLLDLRTAATTSNILGMNAETRHAQVNTTPFMDDAKFNSLKLDFPNEWMYDYNTTGW
jgi:hypothetical protein